MCEKMDVAGPSSMEIDGKDSTKPIIVDFVAGQHLIWSPEDVSTLRLRHRIVCKLWGMGPSSSAPFVTGSGNTGSGTNVAQHRKESGGVPAAMMTEQAELLQRRGIIRVQCLRHILPSSRDKEKFDDVLQKAVAAENENRLSKWLREKTELAEDIAKGRAAKRRKLEAKKDEPCTAKDLKVHKSELVDVKVSKEEVDAVLKEFVNSGKVPKCDPDCVRLSFKIAATSSRAYTRMGVSANSHTYHKKVRTAAYEYFWDCGYFVACGLQFGADFVLYPGDPIQHHSSKMIICASHPYEFHTENSGADVSAKCRLANSVKKTVVFARLSNKNELELTTIRYSNLDNEFTDL